MNKTLQLTGHLMQLEISAGLAADAVDNAKLAELEGDPEGVRLAMVNVLKALADLAGECSASTDRAVGAARTRGISWQEIGNALGISRQSAHARFNGPATTTTRRSK